MPLDISFKSKKLEKICTDFSMAQKAYGERMAKKIFQRINEIQAAETIEMLVSFKVGRCHPLTGNRNGEFAVVLVEPYRLIFKQNDEKIQLVKVIEIVDYH